MFEKAARMKLRFNHRGLCTVEDLWDLPVEQLDSIFKKLNAALNIQKEESLLDTKSSEDELIELEISIIKHIVSVKVNEAKSKFDEKKKAERRSKLLNIIAEKQDDELRGMSVSDLTKLVNDL